MRDPIEDFQIIVAYEMEFDSWGQLADRLQFERKKKQKPTYMKLENALKKVNLSMQVWNEAREVADAGTAAFHLGKNLDAEDVLQRIRGDLLLPEDLVHTRASLERMLKFVDETNK